MNKKKVYDTIILTLCKIAVALSVISLGIGMLHTNLFIVIVSILAWTLFFELHDNYILKIYHTWGEVL